MISKEGEPLVHQVVSNRHVHNSCNMQAIAKIRGALLLRISVKPFKHKVDKSHVPIVSPVRVRDP